MLRTNKIIYIIFFLLLLVTISELFYMLYVRYQIDTSSKELSTVQKENCVSGNSITSALTPTLLPTQQIDANPILIQNDLKRPDAAINDNTLSQWYTVLRWFYNDVLTSSIITNDFEGIVDAINTTGGNFSDVSDKYNQQKYKISLAIRGGQHKNWFFFKEEDLPNITIVELANGKENPINFEKIKVGDKIKIRETINLTKNFESSLLEFKISKIK